MSKKNQRIQKLIALDSMLRHQKRSKTGSATFQKEQLDAAGQVIAEILKLDHVVPAN